MITLYPRRQFADFNNVTTVTASTLVVNPADYNTISQYASLNVEIQQNPYVPVGHIRTVRPFNGIDESAVTINEQQLSELLKQINWRKAPDETTVEWIRRAESLAVANRHDVRLAYGKHLVQSAIRRFKQMIGLLYEQRNFLFRIRKKSN